MDCGRQFRFIFTYFSDQLFELVRFGSVPLHDTPDADERDEPEKEEYEADAHVERQWHEDEQGAGLVENADEANAGQDVACKQSEERFNVTL